MLNYKKENKIMSYSIIFETKIIKLSDGRLLHLNLSGCNNDDAGRSRDDWNGKIYTEKVLTPSMVLIILLYIGCGIIPYLNP